MQVSQILAELDSEIARLQQARGLLAASVQPRRRGRPPLSVKPKTAVAVAPKKRRLTAEERQKIGEAMKRRWAERKKAAAKK